MVIIPTEGVKLSKEGQRPDADQGKEEGSDHDSHAVRPPYFVEEVVFVVESGEIRARSSWPKKVIHPEIVGPAESLIHGHGYRGVVATVGWRYRTHQRVVGRDESACPQSCNESAKQTCMRYFYKCIRVIRFLAILENAPALLEMQPNQPQILF